MNDDIANALSDILPEEVLELIRSLVKNKNEVIDQETIIQLSNLLLEISKAKPILKDHIQKKLRVPVVDKIVSTLSSPDKINLNEEIFSKQEMDKIKNAFYKLYPGLNKNELIKKKTLLQLSIYLLEQYFNFGPDLFPDLRDYWDELSSLDWKIITELFSDTEKIKKHLIAFKGDTTGLVYARELFDALLEIRGIFHNLRFKKVKTKGDVVKYLLAPYLKLASYYEKVSKYALIDMKIVEGRYNPNKNYMSHRLHDIVSSFHSSENYKALGEVNTTVRNAIAHSSSIINENIHMVRFIDQSNLEEYDYTQLLAMTKKLGVLLYVLMGHLNRGYMLEFKLISEMNKQKES